MIYRVDDEADKVTELHQFDLPSFDPKNMKPDTALDDLEKSTLRSGQLIMRRLLEYQWEEVDDLLVESHERAFPPRNGDS
jgi:hypothetical protein